MPRLHEAMVALVAAGTTLAAAVRSEDEAGEENHCHDENHARSDADPRGEDGRLGAARLVAHVRRRRDGGVATGAVSGSEDIGVSLMDTIMQTLLMCPSCIGYESAVYGCA